MMLKKVLFFSLTLIVVLGCNDYDDGLRNYTPGESYFDSNKYIEYLAGDFPIIISVPHDGDLEPSFIPDRTCEGGCNFGKDNFTLEMALGIRNGIYDATGKYIHIIINRLHRRKLDANREIGLATSGNPISENAWLDFHAFIKDAKTIVTRDFGKGFYIDLHGHTHDIQQIELGYLLDEDDLQLDDATLNDLHYIDDSGLRNLANSNPGNLTHAELLRGDSSLGTLLAAYGIASVPSTDIPSPGPGEPYFSGGYNAREHSSLEGGTIDGIQMECHEDIRHDEGLRAAFITAMSEVLIVYMEQHYFPL